MRIALALLLYLQERGGHFIRGDSLARVTRKNPAGRRRRRRRFFPWFLSHTTRSPIDDDERGSVFYLDLYFLLELEKAILTYLSAIKRQRHAKHTTKAATTSASVTKANFQAMAVNSSAWMRSSLASVSHGDLLFTLSLTRVSFEHTTKRTRPSAPIALDLDATSAISTVSANLVIVVVVVCDALNVAVDRVVLVVRSERGVVAVIVVDDDDENAFRLSISLYLAIRSVMLTACGCRCLADISDISRCALLATRKYATYKFSYTFKTRTKQNGRGNVFGFSSLSSSSSS